MNRISTGIRGVDEMLNGGLIPNRTYVLKGGPGAGKTIFAIQYLLEGVKRGENVLYVALEETQDELKEDMKNFDWDLGASHNFVIYDASPTGLSGWKIYSRELFDTGEFDLKTFYTTLKEKIEIIKPTRLVIDPITIFEFLYSSEVDLRKDLIVLIRLFKQYRVTTLLISEYTRSVQTEDFLVSGIIELQTYEIRGVCLRGIMIKKIRGSNFDEVIRPYKITKDGFVVFHKETLPL